MSTAIRDVRPARGRPPRRGFTLLEVLVVMVILTFAVGMLSSAMTAASRLGAQQRESALAGEEARRMLELMRGEDFAQLYARYNTVPDDDPGGAGTGPGANFAVPGLRAVTGDADGLPGQILFPSAGAALYENVENEALGMPRDLDCDGLVDSANHASDYRILPVEVRVQWQGYAGPTSVSFYTMYCP